MVGATETLTISVPAEMAASLRRTVLAGDYGPADKIVKEALEDWAQARRSTGVDVEALRAAARLGDGSGPSIPAAQVFREVRELIDSSHRRA